MIKVYIATLTKHVLFLSLIEFSNAPFLISKYSFIYRSGVGTTGASQTMLYCEVEDKDKVTDFACDEGTFIELLNINLINVYAFHYNN